ncbi:hypothetical protein QUB61_37795 [Microcoleus sp. C2D2]
MPSDTTPSATPNCHPSGLKGFEKVNTVYGNGTPKILTPVYGNG